MTVLSVIAQMWKQRDALQQAESPVPRETAEQRTGRGCESPDEPARNGAEWQKPGPRGYTQDSIYVTVLKRENCRSEQTRKCQGLRTHVHA